MRALFWLEAAVLQIASGLLKFHIKLSFRFNKASFGAREFRKHHIVGA
jgi:hypothetical protein